MKKEIQSHIRLWASIATGLIMGSCATHYVPNVINAPLLDGKGDTRISLHKGISGFDPQFSVAVTDQVALMINASFANREFESNEYHKHQFGEIGAGYLIPLGDNVKSEGFGGIGRGRTRAANYTWDSDKIDSRFTRAFVQYSAGLVSEALEGSTSLRLAMVHFDDRTNGTSYYYEQVVTGKAGSEMIKVVLQIGFSFSLNFEANPIAYNPFILSIGLQLRPRRKAKSGNNSTTAKLKTAYLH